MSGSALTPLGALESHQALPPPAGAPLVLLPRLVLRALGLPWLLASRRWLALRPTRSKQGIDGVVIGYTKLRYHATMVMTLVSFWDKTTAGYRIVSQSE